MTALKGPAIERFLKRPDKTVVLLYGNDAGLVAERAALLAKGFVGADGTVLRLDGKALQADPGRLADEAGAISLFGGRRAIRVAVSGVPPGIDGLIAEPPVETLVLLEYDGTPKPTEALRKRVEAARTAVALPCYADRAADIADVLDGALETAGLTIAPDARVQLLAILGGDRGTTREEIAKLCLYAHGQTEITLDDVNAIVDDSGAAALNTLCDLVAEGEATGADRLLSQLLDEGVDAGVVTLILMRHLSLVERLAAAREVGTPIDVSVKQLRPPVYGDRADGLKRQARLWSSRDAARAVDRLNARSLAIRRHAASGKALIGLDVLGIAAKAAQRRSDRP